jgi:hypothetical protein
MNIYNKDKFHYKNKLFFNKKKNMNIICNNDDDVVYYLNDKKNTNIKNINDYKFKNRHMNYIDKYNY